MNCRNRDGLAGDRGSVVPLLALFLPVTALVLAVIGATAQQAVRSARAQWAADAAALAAAGVGVTGTDVDAAGVLASANGATLILVSIVDDGLASPGPDSNAATPLSPIVVVEIEFEGIQASAAARRFASDGP